MQTLCLFQKEYTIEGGQSISAHVKVGVDQSWASFLQVTYDFAVHI